jgi:hypothetical protein
MPFWSGALVVDVPSPRLFFGGGGLLADPGLLTTQDDE